MLEGHKRGFIPRFWVLNWSLPVAQNATDAEQFGGVDIVGRKTRNSRIDFTGMNVAGFF